MERVCKFTGAIISILAIVSFLLLFFEDFPLNGRGWLAFGYLLSTVIAFLLGLSIHSIGGLLIRVSYLERKLKLSVKDEPQPSRAELRRSRKGKKAKTDSFDMPQKRCPQCSDQHDFDFLKCPRCEYSYDRSESGT